tara:strand:+ start:197 stop:469 length:273 start_codon:yes stop_codon:yes gene_type:complete
MVEYRVVEGTNGVFYPQAPIGGFFGFFRRWKFFYHDADKLKYPQRSIFVITDDPEKAAHFSDAQSAHEFLKRTMVAVDEGWRAIDTLTTT